MFWFSRKTLLGSYFCLSAEALVLCRSVGLPDPLMALVHEEVHVHAGVIRLQGRPEAMDPCSLVCEALGAGGVSADVERVAGAAAVERRLVLADASNRTTGLPDPAEIGDAICSPYWTMRSMMSSVSAATSHDRK